MESVLLPLWVRVVPLRFVINTMGWPHTVGQNHLSTTTVTMLISNWVQVVISKNVLLNGAGWKAIISAKYVNPVTHPNSY